MECPGNSRPARLILHHVAYKHYLAFPAINSLLIKFLADVEIDLRCAHAGRGLDVELLSSLAYLYVGLGRCSASHLTQHGIHT